MNSANIAAARTFAYKILYDVMINGAYANISINKIMANNLKNNADRTLCVNIVYGTLKKKNRLSKVFSSLSDRPVESLNDATYIIIMMSLYQLLYLKKVPPYAVVNDAVNMCRLYKVASASSFTNAVLRNAMRKKDSLITKEADINEYLFYEYGFEKWLIDMLAKQYGREYLLEYAEVCEKASELYIRVNTLKTTQDELIARLKENNITAEKTYVPMSLKVTSGANIFSSKEYKEGLFFAQDLSGAISAYVLGYKAGDKTIDLCAAPGAKSFNAAILSDNGEVTSLDISKNKLELLRRSASQLALDYITVKLTDSSKIHEEYKLKYDKVICDVPCSGLGVIRRKPEILYNISKEHLNKLSALQKEILSAGISYLKEGGELIYSTCTINKNENEAIIKQVLEERDDIKLMPIKLDFDLKSEHPEMKKGMLQLDPPKDACDGFFMAKLKKVK